MQQPMLVAIGEAVWDIFPRHRVLGGAPLNVACHLRQIGLQSLFITRVGTDSLGDEAVGQIAAMGLDTVGVQRHGTLPTGQVLVHFDPETREHSFEILTPAAWDEIDRDQAFAAIQAMAAGQGCPSAGGAREGKSPAAGQGCPSAGGAREGKSPAAGQGCPSAGRTREGKSPAAGQGCPSAGRAREGKSPAAGQGCPSAGRAREGKSPAAGQELFVIFGTLAQRGEKSRKAVQALAAAATCAFYDVNVRAPHTAMELVSASLALAHVVKMNEEELRQICGTLLGIPALGPGIPLAEKLRAHFALDVVAVTAGSRGAYLVTRDEVHSHRGFPAEVADTVGAGDAFFAGLIEGIVCGRKWPDTLARANCLGSFVASRPGATPPMAAILDVMASDQEL